MARPPKTGLDYFPFDTKPDMKLSSIIRKFGVSGLGTLVGLYQKIYDHGYWILVDEDFIEDFCLEFGIDEEDYLKVFIKFSIRKKLFDEGLYKSKKILTSTGIQKRFLEATKRRKCEHDVTFMLVDVDGNLVNVCNNSVNENISTQRKEEKSKGKKSKESFDVFRIFYQGTKRGLETEFDNFCKKHKDWKEVLPDLLELYKCQLNVKQSLKANKEFVAQEKNLQTYINQRSWEEEISNNTNQQTGESEMDKQFRELGFK